MSVHRHKQGQPPPLPRREAVRVSVYRSAAAVAYWLVALGSVLVLPYWSALAQSLRLPVLLVCL